MGAVGGLLGTAGGLGGTGFNAPSGTDSGQVKQAWQGTQGAIDQQNSLLNALKAQNGLQNQSNVYGQLQNVVSGQGPNPAQAQLAQATGANVANQAALMAGQRGAGANVGLMARQNAMQGANLQQQAAGQGASLQAQQSLNALQGAGGMAENMAANQIGQTNANAQTRLGEEGILQGANSANNNIQGNLAGHAMQGQQALIGGAMNALGAAFAGGGQVQKYAQGGSAFGPQSLFGQTLANPQMPTSELYNGSEGSQSLQKGIGGMGKKKEKEDPMEGAEEMGPLGSSDLMDMGTMVAAHGGNVGSKLKSGGHVPGKPKVAGNSYKNDTVKALLSPGEVVIPNSVMQSKDPVRGAAEFVRSVMAKKRAKA